MTLGALSYFEKTGFTDDVDTIIGCSVGTMIGVLMVAGYNILEIISEAADVDLFRDMNSIDLRKIKENTGVINNNIVRDRLSILLEAKFGMVPTMEQLYLATGICFCATTFNLTDKIPVYITADTHPHMSAVEVVLLSINIPFFLYRLAHEGCTYIDGAFGNPYPIDVYDDGNTNILGIYLGSKP